MPYVVQDYDSGHFLAPVQGDVGLVRMFRDAGRFVDRSEASECAIDFGLEQFAIDFACETGEGGVDRD